MAIAISQFTIVDLNDGAPGGSGTPGTNAYVHIRYSQNSTGNPMVTSPVDAKYIGVYSGTSPTAPTGYGSYSWSLIKGSDGSPGTPGVSISKVEVEYYMSTSSTSLQGGSWSLTAPQWVDGSFMWSRVKTSYSSGTLTYSNPAAITGAKGNIGPNGRGVESISSQYYLSTSKTSTLGGSWADTPQPWVAGKFMWTRSKVIYTSPTQTYYTDPVVDTAWEKINGISTSIESLEQVTTPGSIVNTFLSEYGKDDQKSIMKGIIKLWKYGINVGNSLSEINASMAHNGFDVKDGDKLITSLGEPGAVVPTLYNETLVNPNVLQYAPRGVYTVGPTGTFVTLQEAIDWLFRDGKRFLNEQVLLEVYGNQNGGLGIKEIYGGTIIIRLMNGAKIYGDIQGKDLYTMLTIESGGSGRGFINSTGWGMQFNRCMNVKVEGIDLKGVTVGLYATASNVVIRDIDFGHNNFYYAYIAADGASIIAINNRGRASGTRAQTRNGVIQQVGQAPQHGIGNGDDTTNGPIWNTGVTFVPSNYQVPPVTTQTFERYFKVATLDTLSNGGSVSSYYGPTAAQNRWPGNPTWSRGRIRLGREIKDFIAGGTGVQIQIRLRRSGSSHGYRSAIAPTPSNFSAAMGGAEQGQWTSWANISSSYFGDSVDLQLGGNITSNYAIWDAVEVWAKVTKQI